jgi:two-component system NtrC family sensor kinase
MDIKFSIRFFKWLLIVTGILLVFIGVHDYPAQQAVNGLKERYLIVFILLLLSWLSFLRISHGAQEALDQKVQERTRALQNVQSQLLQSEKFSAIGQLAAGIAHEINNPIGFINCNLQTLEKYLVHYRQLLGFLNELEKALNDKDHERMSRIIAVWDKVRQETNFKFIEGDIGDLIKESREGTENMRKIVADLCTFASPDKGIKDSVDLEALMESMLNIAWNEIKYKAQLRKDYSKVPAIICNPQKIGQVFVNLLTNAAHAIQGKGFITIKTYIRDQYVCVDISDTGCGIPPQNITRIFDPFFTTKPVGRGVGLGLSVSYDIVRRHGGNITFSSMVNEGTTFTVMLPAEYVYDSSQL